MRHAPLLLLALPALLAAAWAGPAAAEPPVREQEHRVAGEPRGSAAAEEATLTTRQRLERMRSTGSRTGFEHDTRPRSAAMARQVGSGKRGAVAAGAEAEPADVAPRATRWRQDSVGGTRVRQVRFRRQGEEDEGGP